MPDYFTLAELRALPDVANEAKYPDASCEDAAAYVVELIEREVGTSFIARTVTSERHNGGVDGIVLNRRALSITSATINGTAVTDTLRLVGSNVVYRFGSATASWPTVWPDGFQNITLTYQAGYSATPPEDIKGAALQATRARLMSSGSNDRKMSVTNEQGTVQFAVASERRPFGLPEVDAVILGWRNRLDVLGFA